MGIKLAVFGVGNTLRMDDGIGVFLVREIKDIFDKEKIKVYEIGTETWRIFSILNEEKYENILIVDAINLNFIPGFVYVSKNPFISDFFNISSHEKNYIEDLILTNFCGNIYIFGVEPYKVDWQIGLSDILKEKFNDILEKLITLCNLIIEENKESENDLFRIEKY